MTILVNHIPFRGLAVLFAIVLPLYPIWHHSVAGFSFLSPNLNLTACVVSDKLKVTKVAERSFPMKRSKLLPVIIAVAAVAAVIVAVCLLIAPAQPAVDDPPLIDDPATGEPVAAPVDLKEDPAPTGSADVFDAPDAGEAPDETESITGHALLAKLPFELVTPETLPDDPQEYYLVAALPEAYTWLYARNYGQDSMLLWNGNIYRPFDGRVAHTGHMNLPTLYLLEDNPDRVTVAAVSEVGTGTGVDIYELVAYVMPEGPSGIQDYVYDWSALTDTFNQSNTLTYDAQTNSLTLLWNGTSYQTGTLREDLSYSLELEDGWTGTLVVGGDILRFTYNADGSFTAVATPSIAGSPLSIGGTGFALTWTVRFNGSGFEASGVTVELQN